MQVRKGMFLPTVTIRVHQPRQPAGLSHAHHDRHGVGGGVQKVLMDGQPGAQPQRVVVEADEDSAHGRAINVAGQEGAFVELGPADVHLRRDQIADVRQLRIAHAQRTALPIGLLVDYCDGQPARGSAW